MQLSHKALLCAIEEYTSPQDAWSPSLRMLLRYLILLEQYPPLPCAMTLVINIQIYKVNDTLVSLRCALQNLLPNLLPILLPSSKYTGVF